jgi:hypothetical protein
MSAWWQSGIIYEIYPRSFQDSNGDGVGDLIGINHRLDELLWLGIDAIWIAPFYPSPMVDFGYDISDYCDVDPQFGISHNPNYRMWHRVRCHESFKSPASIKRATLAMNRHGRAILLKKLTQHSKLEQLTFCDPSYTVEFRSRRLAKSMEGTQSQSDRHGKLLKTHN